MSKTLRIESMYDSMNVVFSGFLELFKFSEAASVTTSILGDEEEIFDKLVSDEIFIAEAKEARRQLRQNPSSFTNLTRKYSHLIE